MMAEQADKGPRQGPGELSPLSGSYLLLIIGEPASAEHKELILQRITKGFLSWDQEATGCNLDSELQLIVDQAPVGEEAKSGERLIQYVTENMVTEVLINAQVNTLQQCMKNLLSSYTRHKHIIHAGYAFSGSGSWVLQDGTFSYLDLVDMFQEADVQRLLRAYENRVTVHVHCSAQGEWTSDSINKEAFAKRAHIAINPDDKGSPESGVSNFVKFLAEFLKPQPLGEILEPSDVVGNIRFSRPTLYVFPGGQGDSALFGVNGFNMLVDGGFSRRACFWDFVRHLDRVDALLITRINNCNVSGVSSLLRRKTMSEVYPQIGHVFCNVSDKKHSPDGQKDQDNLVIDMDSENQNIVDNLKQLNVKPQACFRDPNVEPINLYHKVGHGKLDMYVVNPSRDSREVKEFLHQWNAQSHYKSGLKFSDRELTIPLPNLMSICALLVWQPTDPADSITRILFPGSSPQAKIFEGLEKLKHLDVLKQPVCTEKSMQASRFKRHQELRKHAGPPRPLSVTRAEDRIETKSSPTRTTKEEKKVEPRVTKKNEEKKEDKKEDKRIESKLKIEEKKEIKKKEEKKPETRRTPLSSVQRKPEVPKANITSKPAPAKIEATKPPIKAKGLKDATNKKTVEAKNIATKAASAAAAKKEALKKKPPPSPIKAKQSIKTGKKSISPASSVKSVDKDEKGPDSPALSVASVEPDDKKDDTLVNGHAEDGIETDLQVAHDSAEEEKTSVDEKQSLEEETRAEKEGLQELTVEEEDEEENKLSPEGENEPIAEIKEIADKLSQESQEPEDSLEENKIPFPTEEEVEKDLDEEFIKHQDVDEVKVAALDKPQTQTIDEVEIEEQKEPIEEPKPEIKESKDKQKEETVIKEENAALETAESVPQPKDEKPEIEKEEDKPPPKISSAVEDFGADIREALRKTRELMMMGGMKPPETPASPTPAVTSDKKADEEKTIEKVVDQPSKPEEKSNLYNKVDTLEETLSKSKEQLTKAKEEINEKLKEETIEVLTKEMASEILDDKKDAEKEQQEVEKEEEEQQEEENEEELQEEKEEKLQEEEKDEGVQQVEKQEGEQPEEEKQEEEQEEKPGKEKLKEQQQEEKLEKEIPEEQQKEDEIETDKEESKEEAHEEEKHEDVQEKEVKIEPIEMHDDKENEVVEESKTTVELHKVSALHLDESEKAELNPVVEEIVSAVVASAKEIVEEVKEKEEKAANEESASKIEKVEPKEIIPEATGKDEVCNYLTETELAHGDNKTVDFDKELEIHSIPSEKEEDEKYDDEKEDVLKPEQKEETAEIEKEGAKVAEKVTFKEDTPEKEVLTGAKMEKTLERDGSYSAAETLPMSEETAPDIKQETMKNQGETAEKQTQEQEKAEEDEQLAEGLEKHVLEKAEKVAEAVTIPSVEATKETIAPVQEQPAKFVIHHEYPKTPDEVADLPIDEEGAPTTIHTSSEEEEEELEIEEGDERHDEYDNDVMAHENGEEQEQYIMHNVMAQSEVIPEEGEEEEEEECRDIARETAREPAVFSTLSADHAEVVTLSDGTSPSTPLSPKSPKDHVDKIYEIEALAQQTKESTDLKNIDSSMETLENVTTIPTDSDIIQEKDSALEPEKECIQQAASPDHKTHEPKSPEVSVKDECVTKESPQCSDDICDDKNMPEVVQEKESLPSHDDGKTADRKDDGDDHELDDVDEKDTSTEKDEMKLKETESSARPKLQVNGVSQDEHEDYYKLEEGMDAQGAANVVEEAHATDEKGDLDDSEHKVGKIEAEGDSKEKLSEKVDQECVKPPVMFQDLEDKTADVLETKSIEPVEEKNGHISEEEGVHVSEVKDAHVVEKKDEEDVHVSEVKDAHVVEEKDEEDVHASKEDVHASKEEDVHASKEEDVHASKEDMHASKEDVHASKEDVHASKEDVHALKEDVHASKEDVHASKEDVHASKEDVHFSKEDVHASKEDVHASKEDVHASKEDVHASKEDVHASEEDARVSEEVVHASKEEDAQESDKKEAHFSEEKDVLVLEEKSTLGLEEKDTHDFKEKEQNIDTEEAKTSDVAEKRAKGLEEMDGDAAEPVTAHFTIGDKSEGEDEEETFQQPQRPITVDPMTQSFYGEESVFSEEVDSAAGMAIFEKSPVGSPPRSGDEMEFSDELHDKVPDVTSISRGKPHEDIHRVTSFSELESSSRRTQETEHDTITTPRRSFSDDYTPKEKSHDPMTQSYFEETPKKENIFQTVDGTTQRMDQVGTDCSSPRKEEKPLTDSSLKTHDSEPTDVETVDKAIFEQEHITETILASSPPMSSKKQDHPEAKTQEQVDKITLPPDVESLSKISALEIDEEIVTSTPKMSGSPQLEEEYEGYYEVHVSDPSSLDLQKEGQRLPQDIDSIFHAGEKGLEEILYESDIAASGILSRTREIRTAPVSEVVPPSNTGLMSVVDEKEKDTMVKSDQITRESITAKVEVNGNTYSSEISSKSSELGTKDDNEAHHSMKNITDNSDADTKNANSSNQLKNGSDDNKLKSDSGHELLMKTHPEDVILISQKDKNGHSEQTHAAEKDSMDDSLQMTSAKRAAGYQQLCGESGKGNGEWSRYNDSEDDDEDDQDGASSVKSGHSGREYVEGELRIPPGPSSKRELTDEEDDDDADDVDDDPYHTGSAQHIYDVENGGRNGAKPLVAHGGGQATHWEEEEGRRPHLQTWVIPEEQDLGSSPRHLEEDHHLIGEKDLEGLASQVDEGFDNKEWTHDHHHEFIEQPQQQQQQRGGERGSESSGGSSPHGFEMDSPEVRHTSFEFPRPTFEERYLPDLKRHAATPSSASSTQLSTPSSESGIVKDEKNKTPIDDWGEPMGLPSPPPPPTEDVETKSPPLPPQPASPATPNGKASLDRKRPMNRPSPTSRNSSVGGDNRRDKTSERKPSSLTASPKKTLPAKNGSQRRSESPRPLVDTKKGAATGRTPLGSRYPPSSHFYVDLAYVPHHGNARYSNVEFFKRVRARYYVFSGINPSKEVFNSLLEAKQTWEDKDLQVTLIPTYDTDTLGYWVTLNEDMLTKHKIDLAPSASRCTINLQDHETSCAAYRLEF